MMSCDMFMKVNNRKARCWEPEAPREYFVEMEDDDEIMAGDGEDMREAVGEGV